MVYDTFTGANGTSLTAHTPDVNLPLAEWTIRTNGTIALNGNAALSTQAEGFSWPSWAAIESNTCDGTVAVDWTPGAGLPYGPRSGLIVRMSDPWNYWFVGYGFQGTPLALWKVVNGSPGLVTAASVPNPLGQTHHLEVRLEDSSIQVWWDGAQKILWTDPFNAWSTMHGVEWTVNTDWTSTFDNFTVQTPSYQTVSSVVVSPAGSLTGVGAAQFLTATALNAQGQPIPDALFHWTLSDPTRGTLSTSGHYAAAAAVLALAGDLTVTAEMLGGPSGTAAITVDPSRTMIADAFTGANGTNLIAHAPTLNVAQGVWAVHATQPMTLQDGQLTSAQMDCPYQPVATINASTSDGVVSADWTPQGPNPVGGVIVRALNDSNYWLAGYGHQSTKLALFKYVSGGAALVAYTDPGSVQGRSHHIEVRLAGPSIEVWWDGVLRLQASDSYAQTATLYGLMWGGCTDWASRFDNVAVQLPPSAPAHHVTITPATASLPPGALQTFTAQAFDASNAVIPGTLFHWTISNAAAGQIHSTSFFATTAMLYGLTGNETVTATPVAGGAGTASVTVDMTTTLLFDSFTGGNGVDLTAHTPDIDVVGSAWTAHTTAQLVLSGNRARSTQQDSPYLPVALIDASTSLGVIGADWTPAAGLPNGPIGAVVGRASDQYNYWFGGYGYQGTQLALWKMVNGTPALVTYGTIPNPLSQTHHVELRFSGSVVQLWWDGLLQLQVSDAFNQTATKYGLVWGAGSDWLSSFDNFSVQGVPSPAATQVIVTPSNPSVALGGLQILTARALDAQNHVISDALFHWTINDPSGAVLVTPNYFSTSATVRAVAHDVTVSATMAWGPSGSANVVADASHVLVYDTFTGPQNMPLSAHAPDINPGGGTWQTPPGQPVPVLRSGELVPNAQVAAWQMQTAIETNATDGHFSVDWTAASGLQYPLGGLVFRQRDENNFWFAGYGWSTYPLGLWQVVRGNWAPVAWADVGNPAGGTHHLEVVTRGMSIEVLWNGVRQILYRSAFVADATRAGFKWYPNSDWQSSTDTFSVVGSPRCVDAVVPSPIHIEASGASGSFGFAASPTCIWLAEVDVPWLTLTSASSGTGSASVGYSVGTNPTNDWRIGTIAVGGRLVTIVQQPTSPCTVGIWPIEGHWGSSGGVGAFDVTLPRGCSWTAITGSSWIHLLTTSGSGPDRLAFELSPNSESSLRTGTIAVGGWPNTALYTVSQDVSGGGGSVDAGCPIVLSQAPGTIAHAGGQIVVGVSAPAGCSWSVNSQASWLTALDASGTGSGAIRLVAASNSAADWRLGVVSVGVKPRAILQDGTVVQAPQPTFGPSSHQKAVVTGTGGVPMDRWICSAQQMLDGVLLGIKAVLTVDNHRWENTSESWGTVSVSAEGELPVVRQERTSFCRLEYYYRDAGAIVSLYTEELVDTLEGDPNAAAQRATLVMAPKPNAVAGTTVSCTATVYDDTPDVEARGTLVIMTPQMGSVTCEKERLRPTAYISATFGSDAFATPGTYTCTAAFTSGVTPVPVEPTLEVVTILNNNPVCSCVPVSFNPEAGRLARLAGGVGWYANFDTAQWNAEGENFFGANGYFSKAAAMWNQALAFVGASEMVYATGAGYPITLHSFANDNPPRSDTLATFSTADGFLVDIGRLRARGYSAQGIATVLAHEIEHAFGGVHRDPDNEAYKNLAALPETCRGNTIGMERLGPGDAVTQLPQADRCFAGRSYREGSGRPQCQ